MEKISCDVARDLMVTYIDDICSDESKNLVDTHISECRECKAFLETVMSGDRIKEEHELKKIKKMKSILKCCVLFIFIVPVILFFLAFCVFRNFMPETGVLPVQILYLIEMPVLMYTFSAAFSECSILRPGISKAAAVISALSLLFITVIFFIMYNIPDKFTTSESIRFLEADIKCVDVISILTLGAFALCKKSKNSFMYQSMTWMALNLNLMIKAVIYYMSDVSTYRFRLLFGFCFLTAEFIIVNITYKIRSRSKTNHTHAV